MTDNPLSSLVIADEPRKRRRSTGPLLAGFIAVFLATYYVGYTGLLASIFAVGSWWVYKFWPRPSEPLAPEAQAFIDRLEGIRSDEVDGLTREETVTQDALDNLRF